MDPSHKKFVIGGAIAVTLALTLTYFVVSHNSKSKVPTPEMPDASSLPNHNVSSSEKTVLVNARGYIYKYDEGFIPIDIKEVRSVPSKQSTGNGQLLMSGEHAQLTLDYSTGQGTGLDNTILKNLEILVSDAGKDSYKKICDLKPTMDLQYDSKLRFTCPRREVRTCFVGMIRVAELVLESFDVELGGDSKVIGRGEFSKQPIKDGCKVVV